MNSALLHTLLAFAALGFSTASCAQGASKEPTYPIKPIRFIVPYPPGGTANVVGRAVGQKLSELWGQPVVVDNRPQE